MSRRWRVVDLLCQPWLHRRLCVLATTLFPSRCRLVFGARLTMLRLWSANIFAQSTQAPHWDQWKGSCILRGSRRFWFAGIGLIFGLQVAVALGSPTWYLVMKFGTGDRLVGRIEAAGVGNLIETWSPTTTIVRAIIVLSLLLPLLLAITVLLLLLPILLILDPRGCKSGHVASEYVLWINIRRQTHEGILQSLRISWSNFPVGPSISATEHLHTNERPFKLPMNLEPNQNIPSMNGQSIRSVWQD